MFKKVIGVLATVAGLLSGSVLNLTDAQSKYMDQYSMPDPQVWGMIKYGGLTPDLYTGTVRAEIPIYTYTDPDFEIPVSLTYASNGYMPNTQANFCGLGWSLNAGGCITRRVQGERDESGKKVNMQTNPHEAMSGYWEYVKATDSPSVGFDAQWNPTSDTICYDLESTDERYETEPDIYMFNFSGYSGKFVIHPTGKTIVFDSNVPSGEFTIDLSDFHTDNKMSGIKIKTGDGYTYSFGYMGNYWEITNGPDLLNGLYTNVTVNGSGISYDNWNETDSWYLNEIIAPNGRKVEFAYRLDNGAIIQTYEPGATYASESSAFVDIGNGGSILGSLDEYMSSSSFSARFWNIDRVRPFPLLSSISVDGNFELVFSYADRKKETGYFPAVLPNATQFPELHTPMRLSSIKATDKVSETELLGAVMEYKYPSESGNQVLMLSAVTIDGLGSYMMEYYKETDAFPHLNCCAVDHWGYYNSSEKYGVEKRLIPKVDLDENYVETIINDYRDPDPDMALTGMLKTMTYPTGGHTEYKYEPHTYGKIVVRNSLTHGRFRLDLLNAEAIAGGLRLKEVIDYASDGVQSSRTYEYETDEGISSGIMMEFPRYSMCAVKESSENGIIRYHYINSLSSSCPGYLLDGNYIGYSSVKEVYGDGSSKVTRFTSWEEYPDMLDDNDPVPDNVSEDKYPYLINLELTYPANYYTIVRTPTSASSLRGKVMSVKHYGTDGILLRTESMEYDADWDALEYLKSVKTSAADSIYIHHTLCETPLLTGKDIIYPDGTVKEETYTYNIQNQLRSSSMLNCDDSRHTTYYFYPQDIAAGSRTAVEQEMVDSNFISAPVYVIQTNRTGSSEKMTSAIRTGFKKVSLDTTQIFAKSFESMAEITSSLSVTSPVGALNLANMLNYKTLFTWNDYNRLGRPCHMTDVDGVPSLLLWGYGGLYPVAQLKNVTPSQMAAVVHASNAHKSVLGWNGLDTASASAFRGISNSAVTVWKWKPFVGISKKTGPDGRTTSWSYDEYGRLESVTGPDGYKISEYRYNIK
ncbi:MAG: RHS repeat protein [Bacteroidales bacterium]|nr:RHS repeat protein [Bacteroidales bacterium]